MKNISRRVFIKGLAVAGVAAAASTVLAGCNTNMIPGVDGGNEGGAEDNTSSTSTLVLTPNSSKEKETLTVNFGKPSVVGSTSYIVVPVEVINKTPNKLTFDANLDTTNDYKVTAMLDGDATKVVTIAAKDTPVGDKLNVSSLDILAIPDGVTGTVKGNLYFSVTDPDDLKDWSYLSVSVYISTNGATSSVSKTVNLYK